MNDSIVFLLYPVIIPRSALDIVLQRIVSLIGTKHGAIKELAEALGVSGNTVTNWKNGYNKSYPKYLPQIADYYGVSLDWLSGRSEQKERPTIVSDDGPSEEDITEDDLSVDEKMLLSMYREIPKSQKVAAFSGFLDLLKKIEKT